MKTEAADQLKQILDEQQIGLDSTTAKTSAANGWLVFAICAAIVGLALACFARTLTSYFLADDFGHAAYATKIVSGHWDLYLANWTGNFMQIPGMAVYRPWQLTMLIFDVLISHGNPVGYYATNIFFYCADALLIFAICSRLSSSWETWRSLTASTLAAALFVVNPLHCESVSWAVGRVDIECCFYYLGALWFFMQYRAKKKPMWLAASTILFLIGLLIKEMAIGYPIVVTAMSFFGINQPDDRAPFKTRIIRAARESAVAWIATAAYFCVRYAALGTLTGGYTGAIGDGQADSAIRRWFDPETYERVLLPFAASLFHKDNSWAMLLRSCYSALIALFAIKAIRREIPLTLAGFCAVWIASAALPIYKLWGVGMDLEGARFTYFLTVACSATIALLVLAPSKQRESNAAKGDWSIAAVASIVLLLSTFALYKASIRTNAAWVHAGKEVRAVLQSALSMATNSNKKFIVLGIPKKKNGAHLIYNGATLRVGLQPPFTGVDVSRKFLTFDPIFYGPDEYINSARIKRSMLSADVAGPMVWNSEKQAFVDASFKQPVSPAGALSLTGQANAAPVQAYADGHATVQFANGAFTFDKNQIGDGLQFSNMQVDPRQYDYLQFEYRLPIAHPDRLEFQAKWHGTENASGDEAVAHTTVSAPRHGEFHTMRLPVSHFWRWYTCGRITDIALIVPAVPQIEIRNVSLVSDAGIRPTISASVTDDGSGVNTIDSKTKIVIDASKIPGAQSVKLECSKPDYFFDQVDADKQSTATLHDAVVRGPRFVGGLSKDFTPLHHFCEIRARALDADGKPLGEYSEPMIVYSN